jgi:hypothetical protein
MEAWPGFVSGERFGRWRSVSAGGGGATASPSANAHQLLMDHRGGGIGARVHGDRNLHALTQISENGHQPIECEPTEFGLPEARELSA